jgi:hypothetical protein
MPPTPAPPLVVAAAAVLVDPVVPVPPQPLACVPVVVVEAFVAELLSAVFEFALVASPAALAALPVLAPPALALVEAPLVPCGSLPQELAIAPDKSAPAKKIDCWFIGFPFQLKKAAALLMLRAAWTDPTLLASPAKRACLTRNSCPAAPPARVAAEANTNLRGTKIRSRGRTRRGPR